MPSSNNFKELAKHEAVNEKNLVNLKREYWEDLLVAVALEDDHLVLLGCSQRNHDYVKRTFRAYKRDQKLYLLNS